MLSQNFYIKTFTQLWNSLPFHKSGGLNYKTIKVVVHKKIHCITTESLKDLDVGWGLLLLALLGYYSFFIKIEKVAAKGVC